MPATNAEEFYDWIMSLGKDRDVWFRSIGWVEGSVYCLDKKYVELSAWPGFDDYPPGINRYLLTTKKYTDMLKKELTEYEYGRAVKSLGVEF